VDLVKLHQDSRNLLERLADRIPPDRLDTYRTYSDVGEWAELIDALCASLVMRQIPVTPEERATLARLLAMFQTPKEGYAYLSDPQSVLSQLTIVPRSDGTG
jgi:hypothetical protein